MIKNSINSASILKTVLDARKISFLKFVCLFTVFIFFMLAISVQAISAQNPESSLFTDLTKTMGFITGQNYTLNFIKTEYPNLALQVQIAESEFETSFGDAVENIDGLLLETFGEEYTEFFKMMEKEVSSSIFPQQFTQEVAANFIAASELIARGEIPSPVLETLLTYQFIDWPMEEFTLGYNRIFRTKNHPKAKDVDFQIRYPISWRPEEGERPNIIQKFTSENGRGLEGINLMVKDMPLPSDYTITEQDIEDLFAEEEILKEMVPEGGKFISAKPIVLDKHKGAMIVFDYVAQQLDINITSRILLLITIYNGKMIFINCSVSALPGEESKLEERFNLFEPLFKIIANTFIIQEQYK